MEQVHFHIHFDFHYVKKLQKDAHWTKLQANPNTHFCSCLLVRPNSKQKIEKYISSLLGQPWVQGAGMEELERRLRVTVTEGRSWVEEIDGGGVGAEGNGSI